MHALGEVKGGAIYRYEVVARNSAGETRTPLEFVLGRPPQILDFALFDNAPGEYQQVQWRFDDSPRVGIRKNGQWLNPETSSIFTLNGRDKLELRVSNGWESAVASMTLPDEELPQRTISIEVYDSYLRPGETSLIEWMAGFSRNGTIELNPGNVIMEQSGFRLLRPATSTDYSLTVEDDGGIRKSLTFRISVSPDADGDGMPDEWEVDHLGDTQHAGTDDFDLDGSSNLQEFFLRTDPRDSSSFLRILEARRNEDQSVTLRWSSHFGLLYRIDYLGDSGNWECLAFQNGAPSKFADTVFTDATARNAPKRIYRVAAIRTRP